MKLSQKALAISPSLTLKVTAMAKDMKAMGMDIVGFGAGEPDFDTPQHIKDAAIDALNKGMTKYTAASGTQELKNAIVSSIKNKMNLHYDANQIVVSNGAKHSLFNVFATILNPGDEVIILKPFWLTYPELVMMSDGKCVYVDSYEENNFEPKAEDIEKAITEKTKAIIVNSPSNPCGCVYSKETLTKIAQLAQKHNFYIVSDEIYDELIYEGEHLSTAQLGEDAYSRTIIVNGLSKTYSMTGWRIGYTASNEKLAKVMGSYQSHATSNPCSISQHAGVAALCGPQDDLKKMKTAFDERRHYMVEKINSMDGVSCKNPQGAFYVMLNISELIGKKIDGHTITGSGDFTEKLLEKEMVAVIPGLAFGADEFVRLSYATSMQNIKKGLDRIEEFVKKLV